MRHIATKMVFAVMVLSALPSLLLAGKLICPDTLDDSHHRDVMATSAPEIKVRANSQEDGRHWSEIIKPLTQKAIKLAKTQRSTAIEDGVEHGCPSSQVYVGQLMPVPDKPSG